jgi:serine/threonine protein kinase
VRQRPSSSSKGLATGETVAGRYRILERLGAGASGTVYLVEHVHLPGKRFALKLLRADAAAGARARFLAEARLLLDLVHPAIVTVRDIFEDGDRHGFAMDHVVGPSLAAVLDEGGLLAPERAVARAVDVLDALEAAHAAHVVHRDLKPANILLVGAWSDRERAVVVDFGIAKLVGPRRTSSSGGPRGSASRRAVLGTPAYISPEQAAGLASDGRSDLYSLGCVLFAMLAGRPPFVAARSLDLLQKHVESPPPRLVEVAPRVAIPAGLEPVIRRALEKDPARRFPSAAEMRRALSPFLGADPGPEEARREERDVGDPGVSSRDTRLIARHGSTQEIAGRARLRIAPGLSPEGLETVFVLGAPRLRLGRSKPGQSPHAAANTLVLRVLPCRSERLDAAHFRATQGISASHATIDSAGDRFTITDHSRGGTWLDGVRLESGRTVTLPPAFTLGLFDALTLEGCVHGGGAALSLRRRANATTHAYLWVVDSAAIGPGAGAAIRIARGRGAIERDRATSALRFTLPEGVEALPSAIGDETEWP